MVMAAAALKLHGAGDYVAMLVLCDDVPCQGYTWRRAGSMQVCSESGGSRHVAGSPGGTSRP